MLLLNLYLNSTNFLLFLIQDFVSSLIVNSVYFTADLVNGQDLFTSQGSRIRINVSPGKYLKDTYILLTLCKQMFVCLSLYWHQVEYGLEINNYEIRVPINY